MTAGTKSLKTCFKPHLSPCQAPLFQIGRSHSSGSLPGKNSRSSLPVSISFMEFMAEQLNTRVESRRGGRFGVVKESLEGHGTQGGSISQVPIEVPDSER